MVRDDGHSRKPDRSKLPDSALEHLTELRGPVTACANVARGRRDPVWRLRTTDALIAVKSDRDPDRTAREAAVLAARGHLIASDVEGERPWLAMPWWDGPTTHDRWAALRHGTSRHIIALRSALLAAADLCRAVGALHDSGWVHGDLRPHRCVHAADGARLIGYAAARGPAGAVPPSLAAVVPYPAGRIDFVAPEVCAAQLEGRTPEPGPEAEVYTLAAVLWHCWTGQSPFDYRGAGGRSDDPPEQRAKLVAAGLPQLRVPQRLEWPRLRSRLSDAMSPDPDARPSAIELARALENLLPTATT